MTTTIERHLACEGVFNLRDLGGYRTNRGFTTRWRTVFRADGLHRIPARSARSLDHLGVRTVIDLRTDREEASGVCRLPGAETVHAPILREPWDADAFPHIDDPVQFLVERYLYMLVNGAGAVKTVFEALAAARQRPVVFHCAAGKDRTGVVAGLLLAALGVSDETIAHDYALSAAAMKQLLLWLQVHEPEAVDAMTQQPAALLACPQAAMTTFLKHVRTRYGSVPGYLTEAGVPSTLLADVRNALLS